MPDTPSTTTNLCSALAQFQSQHHAAGKDSKGNYGTYTSLAGALNAIQPATAFGLSHTQTLQPISDDLMVLRTTLMHVSGETVTSDLPIPIRYQGGRGNEFQALGSALTYSRRYTLLALYGLAGEDDEGEAAAPAPAKAPVAKPQAPTPKQESAPAAAKPPVDAPADPPLAHEDREEILGVLKGLRKSNPTAFDAFCADFRKAFGLEPDALVAKAITSKKHGVWAQEFFSSLPVA